MLLEFSNGDPFATGVTRYSYDPMTGGDNSARLILEVGVQGRRVNAILDTAAPYMICSLEFTKLVGFHPDDALSAHRMQIRGYRVEGRLHRVPLEFIAGEGQNLSVEVTAFVPDPAKNPAFTFPSFLGFHCCLEWIRFAVDPVNYRFYFGPHA